MYLFAAIVMMMMMLPAHGVVTFDPHGIENVQMTFTDAEFEEHYTGHFEVKNMIRCNIACLQVILESLKT